MSDTKAKEIAEEALENLTGKQAQFVIAYFESNFNATEAARMAGYSAREENFKRVAYDLLQKPHIKEAISKVAEARGASLKITDDYVLGKLKRAIETAEQSDNLTALLRGLEILMRQRGMFVDKQEITGKDGAAIQIEQEKKVRQDAADFASAMAGLIKRSSTSGVSDESVN